MKSNRVTAIFLTCSLLFSLTVAQGDSNRARLKEARSMALPVYAVLDEHAQPVIAASGKVGFISSVTAGSLISFSVQTGKRLSAMVVGATAGPVSMVETRQHRLLAVPAANAPQSGHPATVSIIDARNARQLALRSLLFLPTGAHITPNTQAYLTRDGRFCVIASSFHEPALYSFNVETGEIVSQLPLLGRASEVDFYEDGSRRTLAVASAVANTVSIIRLDENGQLISSAVFSPTDARIAEGNNPAFSADGRALYIAAT
ncbi:MAG TPA: hypothetical protein VNO70_14945, partial [Blastocatellia bacterium]|nr:hypothetical protein [Blastocatellia bacterium]